MITAVLYNLPNRDCSAYASTGVICCGGGSGCDLTTGGNCEKGLSKYKNQYINVIAGLVRDYCGRVPMAFIIEPDALPNMVTGLSNPRCSSSATKAAYREGIAYAVNTLSNACKKSPLYIHAGGGNWLGWRQNALGFAQLIKSMKITKYIRGFATNVSGYQIVGKTCPSIHGICASVDHPCCRLDPCGLAKQWNEGFNEANYVRLLREVFSSTIPEFKPKFVIDTGRAGESNSRRNDCGNWCNVRHALIGPRPTSRTGIPSVDAFLWVKGPTESDGCTRVLPNGETCSRFDSICESADSFGGRASDPRAPEAGAFFNAHFKKMLGTGK